MSEKFTSEPAMPDLNKDAGALCEVNRLQSHINVAFYAEGHPQRWHEQQAHESIQKLADAMGYTLMRKVELDDSVHYIVPTPQEDAAA